MNSSTGQHLEQQSRGESASCLLAMRDITRTFPGVRALDGVDLTLKRGEVHALMGENGAGKSTLIKVLTGVYPRERGTVLLEGHPIDPRTPLEAQHLGISTVYQEVNLVPGLSVAENLYLGRQPCRWGRIDWRVMHHKARAALQRLDLDLDVAQPLDHYSIAIQQMVAIARSVDVSARVLILDEPTSSLDRLEVERLFAVIRQLKAEGLGILFVTHFMDQVYEISDQITVLRNGRRVGQWKTANLPRLKLIGHMMGREIAEHDFAPVARDEAAPRLPLVRVRGLRRRGGLEAADFDLTPGQAVGLAGLLGSGRTELARLLFGLDTPDAGTIEVDGKPFSSLNPRQAIKLGFGFSPEDRKVEGILPDLSVRENMVIMLQARQGWLRRVAGSRQREIVERFIKAMNIATSDAEKPIRLLSGGNQQKVILARWIAANPRLLMLDEPTRGVDVGARAEIMNLIDGLRREGLAIMLISSELEEITRACQRVIVLRDRRKVGELANGDVSVGAIMEAIAHGSLN
jgi:simple sugar transport system ATP-binding protein